MSDNDPLALAAAWRDGGHGVALATVVATWGSSPRPAGSQLVVRDDGVHQGSVSGGCIEGAVIEEALAVIEGGPARLLSYGVTNDRAWEVGLSCGGTVEVHVAPLPEVLDQLLADRAAQRPVALVTNLKTGEAELVHDHQALREDRSRRTEGVFVQVHNPPHRLIIVGAVHIAQALVQMAQIAGYRVILIDPRGAFASGERFADLAIIDEWPDKALSDLAPDARCAVVTLSHDPKLDDPALAVALRSEAFYIGCLGSRRTHAKRLERLAGLGFAADETARLHGPVGLDIGAQSPVEIALSIMAEITRARRKP
jgi:xanthine dehydrogenase accessory factor